MVQYIGLFLPYKISKQNKLYHISIYTLTLSCNIEHSKCISQLPACPHVVYDRKSANLSHPRGALVGHKVHNSHVSHHNASNLVRFQLGQN